MKWAISEHGINLLGLRYWVDQETVLYGMSFIIPILIFLYISFAKIFCQNLVKKNRKLVAGFSLLNVVIECEHG